jgi:Do/DeqQ family serine protease
MARLRSLHLVVILIIVAVLAGAAGAALSSRVGPRAVEAAPPAAAAPAVRLGGASSPFVAAVARIRPAVVNISTERTVQNPFGDFQQFLGPLPGLPSGPIQQKGIGSGVIVSRDGYILTNAHVVAGAQQLTVTLLDGRTFKGRVVGTDPASDLAVVKIPASALPAASLGDSAALQPGDWAIAIGNPYGLNFTVTVGVISATGRTLPDGPEETFIQTDAAINPGNSGGPLVDTAGRVIGINTAKFQSGEGIGFAIPIDTAKGIMAQLIATGHVVRPYLGVYLQPLTPDLASALHVPAGTRGVVVADVVPNSPAAAAGLQRGDVVVRVDGHPVADARALAAMVRQSRVGTKLLLLVLRQGHTQYATATVGQMPSGQ